MNERTPVNISRLLTLPEGFVTAVWKGYAKSHTDKIAPAQLGLTKSQKAWSSQDWEKAQDFLEENCEGETAGEPHLYPTAFKTYTWIEQKYSISNIIRMLASWSPDFKVLPEERKALSIYALALCSAGAVRNSDGHSALPLGALVSYLVNEYDGRAEDDDKIQLDTKQVMQILQDLKDAGLIDFHTYVTPQGYNHKQVVYIPSYLATETALVTALQRSSYPLESPIKPDLEGLSEDQTLAVLQIWYSTTVGNIQKGLAGTGKTFVVKRITAALGEPRCLALATTGAATQVLSESLGGVRTMTISRAAMVQTGADADAVNDPLRRLLIVDECSMLNMSFTRQLLKVINREAGWDRIILVGDPLQLPPVGVGALYEALASRDHGITKSELLVQHRLPPAGQRFLQVLGQQTTSVLASYQLEFPDHMKMPLAPHYPQGPCTNGSFHTTSAIQSYTIKHPQDILMDLMRIAPHLGANGFGTNSRELISCHRNATARWLSQLIEYIRNNPPEDLEPWGEAMLALCKKIDEVAVKVWGSKAKNSARKAMSDIVLFGEIGNSKKVSKALIAELGVEWVAHKQACEAISRDVNPFGKNTMVRCQKNVWAKTWRADRLQSACKKMGISQLSGELTNGMILIHDNGMLVGPDSGATCRIVDATKAARYFPLAWVSTTHKLQGDAGAVSYHILEPMVRSALVYVALSRGRQHNRLVVPYGSQTWLLENKGQMPIPQTCARLSIFEEIQK